MERFICDCSATISDSLHFLRCRNLLEYRDTIFRSYRPTGNPDERLAFGRVIVAMVTDHPREASCSRQL